jgi:lipid II:glycine glycyltransferase (peptidoglycan interpeptide bridge formation enzyme)
MALAYFLLNLKKTEKETWDSLPSKTRNMIRRGQKALIIREGHKYLWLFYAMYVWVMVFKKIHPYPLKHFFALKKIFGKNMKIIIALDGKRPVGATLLLLSNIGFYPYQVAADHTYAPTSLMIWECMKICIREGIDTLDMGDSTPGGGTYNFKQNFGGLSV